MNTEAGNDITNPEDTMVDGGTPTPEEARLAQELADEEAAASAGDGKNGGAGADAAADAVTTGDDAAGDDDAGAADGEGSDDDDANASAAAAAEAVTAASAASAMAAVNVAAQPAKPEAPVAPMDFDAEYKANQEAFDSGEKSAEEFQTRVREISKAESGFIARTEIFNERQQTAAQRAQEEFATAAAAWEAEHKDFMANPLYAKVMQDAINAVDQKTPGLAPADLMAAAAKAAFEFTRYTPPTATAAADAAKAAEETKRAAIAKAKAERKPGQVPATLGATPTGAHVDTPTGSAFANLDALDIDSLENKVASMSPEQLEAYLQDAPGAKATGQ